MIMVDLTTNTTPRRAQTNATIEAHDQIDDLKNCSNVGSMKPWEDIASRLYNDFPTSSTAALRIMGAVAGLCGTPLVIYNCIPSDTISGNIQVMINCWDALLHVATVPLALAIMYVAVRVGGQCCWSACRQAHAELCRGQAGPPLSSSCCLQMDDKQCERWSRRLSKIRGSSPGETKALLKKLKRALMTVDGLAICLGLAVGIVTSCLASVPLLYPSWYLHPFALFNNYHVYPPSGITAAIGGMCPEQKISDAMSTLTNSISSQPGEQQQPLCLSEASWRTLSSGALSSRNPRHVKTVVKGIEYARHTSGGIAVSVLARDIAEDLQAFRDNMEGLQPFVSNLAVVIFENDSGDGSREAIKKWASQVEAANLGYQVDLIECEEAKDCKFGKGHRDANKGADWGHTTAIGDMDKFRQRITNYVAKSPKYQHFSHMLVVDIDLAVSLSPLGVVHTLGLLPENPVACSGRMSLPGGFGSLITPYDYSAFLPIATRENRQILSLHEQWCNLMPPGTRWRNQCNAISAPLTMEMLRADRGKGDFYQVQSAFNGAVLYPLSLVRESQAVYDAGDDGQRCEHIGFNLALKKPMYVNRRWDMHLHPARPGGPTGWRAHRTISYIFQHPRVAVPFTLIHFIAYLVFIHSCITLGVYVVYPLLAPVRIGGKNIQDALASKTRPERKRSWGCRRDDDRLLKIV
jgi:hypothetical protein